MLLSQKGFRVAAVLLMLCISAQVVAFASPPCACMNSPDQMVASEDCHVDTPVVDSCCEQQCQTCSMLSATISTEVASANSLCAGADRIAHDASHFYRHTPLPHLRPPLS